MDSRLIDSIILGNTDLAEMEFQDAMRDRVAAAFEVRKVELASGLLPSDELNEGMYDFSLDAYNGMPYEVWKMYKDYNVKQGGRIRIQTPDEMEFHGKTAVVRGVSDGLVHVQLDDTGRKLALTPNQLKPITMNEARIPLEGHPYHDKSDEQLRYIIKDAGEAAKAMKEVNPAAESRYLDQVNDASTVLNYRKRSAGRAVTEALSPKTNAAYGEYEDEEKYRASDTCPSCEGEGNHGYEEESGKEHTCFACGGTGKYFSNGRKVSEAYSKDAVNKAIASSNRSGRKIGGKEAKAIHRLLSGGHEESTPDLAVRKTYTQTYAKHAKTAKDVKAAMHMAYDEVERQHGPEALKALKSYHTNNMQKESMDKVGREDADINNDGKTDKTDKYLHNRRKAIGRAIAKKNLNEQQFVVTKTKQGPANKSSTDGKHYGLDVKDVYDNEEEAQKAADDLNNLRGYKKEDKHNPLYGGVLYAAHPRLIPESEQIDEISDTTKRKYLGASASDLAARSFEHGNKYSNKSYRDSAEATKQRRKIQSRQMGIVRAGSLNNEEAEQMNEFGPLIAAAARVAVPVLMRAAPRLAAAAGERVGAAAAEKGIGATGQKIASYLARKGTTKAITKTADALQRRGQQQQQNEMAPPGDKYERMVKDIKAKYAKGGLTDQERSIAYATAWKAKREAENE